MDSSHLSPYRPDGKLYGFICVVIGSDLPLGSAIVHELASHGAACIYACPSSAKNGAAATAAAEPTSGCKVLDYPIHVADEQDTLGLIDEILNTWGRLDIWVTTSPQPTRSSPLSISETSPSDLLHTFQTTSMPAFLALKYAPPAMRKLCSKGSYPNAVPKDQAYGSIVVVGSLASGHGGAWGPSLTTSAHASLGLVRSGVSSLRGTGVRINYISRGMLSSSAGSITAAAAAATGDTAPGADRAGLPAEVARVVGFLASGFSSYVTGANLVVDGGVSVGREVELGL